MGDQERTDVLAGGDRAVEEPAKRVLDDRQLIDYVSMVIPASTQAVTWATNALNTFEPEFVDRARAAWNDLLPELPRRNLMRNVTFKWLLRHPYRRMQTFEINAWTNSSTEIYLRAPPSQIDEDVWWRAVLYHEAVHVKQFASEGGPPDTYTKMMEYEVEAYGDTYKWLANTEHPDRYRSRMDRVTKAMKASYDFFNSELAMVKNSTAHIEDPQVRHEEQEKAYRSLLLGKRYSDVSAFLPPHDDLKELYGL